ncbi:MAG: hypothetical protein J5493_05795 [Lachnospiraceae bacterium]|nr:hypothetical protein [Lachnospiraceae bacterium]
MIRKRIGRIIGIVLGLLILYLVLCTFNVFPITRAQVQPFVVTPSGRTYLVVNDAQPVEDVLIRTLLMTEEIDAGQQESMDAFRGYRFYRARFTSDDRFIYAVTPEGKIRKCEARD